MEYLFPGVFLNPLKSNLIPKYDVMIVLVTTIKKYNLLTPKYRYPSYLTLVVPMDVRLKFVKFKAKI